MTHVIPTELLQNIDHVLDDAASARIVIPVYREAERIRSSREDCNIALEDIVEQFIERGRMRGVAFEIDPRHAADAVMGRTNTVTLRD